MKDAAIGARLADNAPMTLVLLSSEMKPSLNECSVNCPEIEQGIGEQMEFGDIFLLEVHQIVIDVSVLHFH